MLNISLSVFQPFDSSVESSLFRSVLHFFFELGILLVTNFLSSLYILEIRSLSDVGLVKIFSHSVGCRFILLTMFLLYRSFSVSGGLIY